MRILVSGSTGLIGSRLVAELIENGDGVVRLVRGGRSSPGSSIAWSPEEGRIDAAQLEGFNAIVHLAGENIASGRWTREKKRRIRDSRLKGTRHLAECVARLTSPPQVFISSSATGFYGDRGETALDESAESGHGFLADVCREWEKAAQSARDGGTRVVTIRTGVVLSAKGGALAKMRLPFSLGLGGRMGSGRQYMSWISHDDIVGAIRHALTTPALEGPVNGVAPSPVTNAEFTRALGRALGRPTPFPVPQGLARLALGEMADELLFTSQRVLPTRLLESGYRFRYPEIGPALEAALSSR